MAVPALGNVVPLNANRAVVIVPLEVVTNVPVVLGNVNVAVTASVGVIVVEPDVAPAKTNDPMSIPLNYKMTHLEPAPSVTLTPEANVTGPVLIALCVVGIE